MPISLGALQTVGFGVMPTIHTGSSTGLRCSLPAGRCRCCHRARSGRRFCPHLCSNETNGRCGSGHRWSRRTGPEDTTMRARPRKGFGWKRRAREVGPAFAIALLGLGRGPRRRRRPLGKVAHHDNWWVGSPGPPSRLASRPRQPARDGGVVGVLLRSKLDHFGGRITPDAVDEPAASTGPHGGSPGPEGALEHEGPA